MTVPAAPSTIYLSNVKNEFGVYGATVASNLTAYLKATPGSYVGPSPFTSGVPTALPLKLSSFSGTANNNTGTPTFNNTYTSGTNQSQPIQPGTKVIVAEAWGGGGGGSPGTNKACGGAGGSGGYVRTVITLVAGAPGYSANWGKTLNYNTGSGGAAGTTGPFTNAGNGSNANISLGTFTGTFTTMQAGGAKGATSASGCICGQPGAAGAASGGSANNTAGKSGSGSGPGSGGGAIIGDYSTATMPAMSAGAGGAGGIKGINPGAAGGTGNVRFTWL